MESNQQTNTTETVKAAKRRHLRETEDKLQKLRTHRNEVADRVERGRGHSLDLRSESSSQPIRLMNPDFMSLANYLKLYLLECDDAIRRVEKELDEFVY